MTDDSEQLKKLTAEVRNLAAQIDLFGRHQHVTNETITNLAYRIEELGARLARLEDHTVRHSH
jgi:hypothetical protein